MLLSDFLSASVLNSAELLCRAQVEIEALDLVELGCKMHCCAGAEDSISMQWRNPVRIILLSRRLNMSLLTAENTLKTGSI